MNISAVSQQQYNNGAMNPSPNRFTNHHFSPVANNHFQQPAILLLLLVLIQQLISQLQNGGGNQTPLPQGQGEALNLPQRQQDAIRQRFDDTSPLAFDGLATQFTGKAFDDNQDGQLSAGDSIEIRRFGGNGIPPTDFTELYTLTDADINQINSLSNQPVLNLNDEQMQRLQSAVLRQDVAYIPGDGPRLDSVIDARNDGQLSVGDTLKIVTTTGFETGNPNISSRFEPLTQEQFARFEAGIPYTPSFMN